MKRTLLFSLLLFAFSYSSVAQYITAEDNASNYASWTNGSNQGFGFGVWSINNVGGAGNYIGNSGLSSNSFAIYSGQTGGLDNSVVSRTFSNVLGIGTKFSCNLGYTSVENGGEIGISFFSNSSFRLNLKFIGGQNYWILNDGGFDFYTTIPFDDYAPLFLSLQRGSSDNKYIIYLSQGTHTYNSAMTEYTANSGVFDIDRIDIYSKEQGSGNNLGFNDLKIEANNTNILGSGESVIINGNPTLTNNLSIQNLTIPISNSFTISPGKSLTVNGTLTNNAGVTGLVIKSDASGTGSLIHSNSGVDATVERYVSGGWGSADAGWHQISSPVASQAISSFETSGAGNGYDFYGWDEPTNMWMNYKDGGFSTWNGGTNFNVGQGYLISYETTQTGKSFTGALNTANVTKTNLTRTGPSISAGFHLLGNPFASAITWNDGNWALTDVAGTAKIWNEVNKSYSDIVANGYIPSAQGFMIQVADPTNSITIPLASRVHNSTNWYKSGDQTEKFFLIASEQSGLSAQESQILVNPDATPEYDFDFDSHFLAGYAPQFYSTVGDIKLSTNALPSLPDDAIIPFGFVKNEASQFNITMQEQISGYIVYLNDLLTGVQHNLTDQPVYNFTSAEGDDPNRFLLYFAPVSVNKPAQSNVFGIYSYAGQVYISNTPSNAQITLSTLTGQVVMQRNIGGSGLVTLNAASLPKGVYIVTVQGEGAQVSRKVVL